MGRVERRLGVVVDAWQQGGSESGEWGLMRRLPLWLLLLLLHLAGERMKG